MAFTQQPVEDERERPFVCDGLWRGGGVRGPFHKLELAERPPPSRKRGEVKKGCVNFIEMRTSGEIATH
jgi:hypothetical protein